MILYLVRRTDELCKTHFDDVCLHWRVAQLGGQGGSSVVVTAWYWSNLWKDCYEDSAALVNCVDFGVLWNVKCGYINCGSMIKG